MRTLLIDADIVAFKFVSVNERVYRFDEDPEAAPAVASDFEEAKVQCEGYIAELKAGLEADAVIVCLSDPMNNFRKDVWAGYKAQRLYAHKPVDLMPMKEWLATKYQTYQRPGLEADDCMGILATAPTLVKGEKVIVSEDKDLQGIPGLLHNPRKDTLNGLPKIRRISKLAADRYHLFQTVVGDATDGYPGARGVGPKSEEAEAVMKSRSVLEAWQHVMAAFRRSKAKPEDAPPDKQALIMARLARILRATDWNFTQKRPVLWSPPIAA